MHRGIVRYFLNGRRWLRSRICRSCPKQKATNNYLNLIIIKSFLSSFFAIKIENLHLKFQLLCSHEVWNFCISLDLVCFNNACFFFKQTLYVRCEFSFNVFSFFFAKCLLLPTIPILKFHFWSVLHFSSSYHHEVIIPKMYFDVRKQKQLSIKGHSQLFNNKCS